MSQNILDGEKALLPIFYGYYSKICRPPATEKEI